MVCVCVCICVFTGNLDGHTLMAGALRVLTVRVRACVTVVSAVTRVIITVTAVVVVTVTVTILLVLPCCCYYGWLLL